MARPKGKPAAESKDEGQSEAPQGGGNGGMTKSDAVRAAIREGVEKPTEAVEFIKRRFNIDITTQNFSTIKSLDKKKAGGGATGGNGQHPSPAGDRRQPAADGANDGNVSPADLARQVKHLVERYGAGAVKEMAEVFG